MATLITGISTAGLTSSPSPDLAWRRREDNPGEYSIRVNLTSGLKLELVTDRQTFHNFTRRTEDILASLDADFSQWNREWLKLDTLARSGIDLTDLANVRKFRGTTV